MDVFDIDLYKIKYVTVSLLRYRPGIVCRVCLLLSFTLRCCFFPVFYVLLVFVFDFDFVVVIAVAAAVLPPNQGGTTNRVEHGE